MPSLLCELYLGRVRWDLLRTFREQDPDDRRAGDAALGVLAETLHVWIDPEEVDASRRLPDGFLDALQDGGFLRLTIDRRHGGLGLSALNAFRVVEAAASWSMPAAFALAIANGFGSGSYLPILPDGPLREMIAERVAAGIVSAGADAEAAGTANSTRTTVAVPVDGGAAYLITGEKLFIGNGPIADLMDVSATVVAEDGTEEVKLFFVDTRSPGFEVTAWHEFMGLRGAAIGALRLDSVRVPAEYLLDDGGDGWRMRPRGDRLDAPPADLGSLAATGRMLVIGPPSLAIAKLCLLWSRDFVGRRRIDGRGLGEYEAIQRLVAATAADVFLIETVANWTLLGHGQADVQPDLTPAKNIASLACWRTVDRTLSLLGAEGYETARSKQRRGARALPVERAFRDARALRVAGGVDFMLDRWSAESSLVTCYYGEDGSIGDGGTAAARGLGGLEQAPRCLDHASYVEAQARTLSARCRELTRSRAQEELFERQHVTTTVGRIASELLSMSLVLARAAGLAGAGAAAAVTLADISCSASRHRLRALWAQLGDVPDYAAAADEALRDDGFGFLLTDLLVDGATPPTYLQDPAEEPACT